MYITAFFTTNGTPTTGLSPTINIRNVATGALLINGAAMAEVGDGHYRYWYAAYSETNEYAIRCDGGATLPASERYTYGGNDNYVEDVGNYLSSDCTNVAVCANIYSVRGTPVNDIGDFQGVFRLSHRIVAPYSVSADAITTATTFRMYLRIWDANGDPVVAGAITANGTCVVLKIRNGVTTVMQNGACSKVQGYVYFDVTMWDNFALAPANQYWTAGDMMQVTISNTQVTLAGQVVNIYEDSATLPVLDADTEVHALAALNTYDPPTRAEATADKDEILASIQVNSVKLDTLLGEDTTAPIIADVRYVRGVPVNSVDDFKADLTPLIALVTRVLGMVQENFYIDNTTFDASNNMTAGRIRTYTNNASVGTNADVLATYNVTASYDADGNMDWYSVAIV